MNLLQAAIIGIYALATSAALVFLKLGSSQGSPIQIVDGKINFNLSFYIISGIVLYGLSFIVYIYLISRYDLGYIIPLVTALVYVLVFIASFVIFKESFGVFKIIAISMIIFGAVLLNINK